MTVFNPSPPGPNNRHTTDDIFVYIFVNQKFRILIKISLKFVPEDPIDKTPNFGLDNGLAPNRRQAIIWINADPIHWLMRHGGWDNDTR